MNNTNEDLTRLASELKTRERWLVGVESGVYLAVILTAFLGNTLLITAVYKTSMIRNRQNYYLVSLAATDILSAVAYMPFTLAVLIQGERPFGEFFCQLQGSVLAVSGGVSMLTLGMIAFNRYVKIFRSVTLYQKIFSKQKVLISIAISWIATVVSIVVAFSLSKAVFYYHPGKSLCWLQISLANKESLYCLGVYSLWIFIATTTIAFCYYKIFRKVHEHFAQVANSSVHNDNSAAFNEEVKISTMLFIIIIHSKYFSVSDWLSITG